MQNISTRLATLEDIPHLVRHRHAMFEEMGLGTTDTRALMDAHFVQWAKPKMLADEFLSWLACDGDAVVAGAGCWFINWPPNPDGDVGQRAYVYNVYTEKAYRSQGIARRLMQTLLDACRQRGIYRVALHASDAGRALYEKLGFFPTKEMGLFLD